MLGVCMDCLFAKVCGCVMVLLLAGCTMPANEDPHPLVIAQYAQYPEMEMQDWYKLFHQAAMGNRHLGVEDSLVFNYMLHELSMIEEGQNEPLIEYISPDSQVVRLNLKPYKAAGGDPEILFASMKATWDTVVPDPNLLEQYAQLLKPLAASKDLGFTYKAWQQFIEEKKAEGFPAIHHSPNYEEAYKPAYRVLLKQFAPE